MHPQHPDEESTGEASLPASDEALNSHLARLWASGRSLAAPLKAYAAELSAGAERHKIRRLIRQLETNEPPVAGQQSNELHGDLLVLLSAGTTDQEMGSRLVDFIRLNRRWSDAQRRVVAAVVYPLVLLLIAMAIVLACTAFLAPVYRSMYVDFQTELPGLTVLIIRISDMLHATGGLVLLLPLVGLFAMVLLYRNFVPQGVREYLLDWVPFIGRVLRFSGMTRFTSCLSGLTAAGVPTAASLRLAGRGSCQARIQQAADRVASQMELGATSVRLEGFPPRIPATVVHTLQTESSPAKAADTLRQLAGVYDTRAQEPLEWIGGIFEPLFVILVGGLVGLLLLGLLLPFVSLIHALA